MQICLQDTVMHLIVTRARSTREYLLFVSGCFLVLNGFRTRLVGSVVESGVELFEAGASWTTSSSSEPDMYPLPIPRSSIPVAGEDVESLGAASTSI